MSLERWVQILAVISLAVIIVIVQRVSRERPRGKSGKF
jgi:hypothetical protein